jgi:hypothetical protein
VTQILRTALAHRAIVRVQDAQSPMSKRWKVQRRRPVTAVVRRKIAPVLQETVLVVLVQRQRSNWLTAPIRQLVTVAVPTKIAHARLGNVLAVAAPSSFLLDIARF